MSSIIFPLLLFPFLFFPSFSSSTFPLSFFFAHFPFLFLFSSFVLFPNLHQFLNLVCRFLRALLPCSRTFCCPAITLILTLKLELVHHFEFWNREPLFKVMLLNLLNLTNIKTFLAISDSGIVTEGSRIVECPPDSKKFASNRGKEGKSRKKGKLGKRGKNRKKKQGSFTLPPLQVGLVTPLISEEKTSMNTHRSSKLTYV